ncbi:hypothetical protein Tco_0898679 [Tanacetum coccineum]
MFLIKIRDNTFNGIIRENVFKHINNILEVVWPLKVKGLSPDRFRLSVFPILLAGVASEWFKKYCIGSITTWEDMVKKIVQNLYQLSDENDEVEADEDDDPDDIDEIFKIEGNLFNYETPLGIKTYEEYELNNNMTGDLEELWSDNGVPYQLCDHICEPYHFKNGKTKWTTCSLDINGFCSGGELPGMIRVRCMTYFQDHKWYNELADGKLKVKALMHKAKVNAHEITPFTSWENYGQGPYANLTTEKTYDPYLDINHIFGRNYRANNVGDTQGCQERKEEHNKHTESSKPAHDPSICQVRRFEMIKYSFDVDDEYVAIKEHECSDHSKTNIDACQAYRELFRVMDEGWLMTKACEE